MPARSEPANEALAACRSGLLLTDWVAHFTDRAYDIKP